VEEGEEWKETVNPGTGQFMRNHGERNYGNGSYSKKENQKRTTPHLKKKMKNNNKKKTHVTNRNGE